MSRASNPEDSRVQAHAALLLLLALSACGHGTAGSATQVVAKVNDREITIAQLSQALDGIPTSEFNERATGDAVAALVDEELLVQEAMAAKLDHDPDVLLDMERNRRQALLRAYLDRSVYSHEPIAEAEKRAYYDAHPLLFSRRRVYHVATFNTKEKVLSAPLKDDLKVARTVTSVQEALNRHNVAFALDESAVGPEDLPLPLLPEFAKAASGDVVVAPLEDGTLQLVEVIGFTERPLSFEQAGGRIERWLRGERNQAARKDHLAKSRASASISYTGAVAGAGETR